MYTSDDFGPAQRSRRTSVAAVLACVAVCVAVGLLVRGPVADRFRLWRLRSGSAEAREASWRLLVVSDRGAWALQRLDYAESAPFSTVERFGPAPRAGGAAPVIEFLDACSAEGETPEDILYIKLAEIDSTSLVYVPMPPKVIVWARPGPLTPLPELGACRLVSRVSLGSGHQLLDVQLADSVRYAVEVNSANRVMRLRFRRDASVKQPAFRLRLTPTGPSLRTTDGEMADLIGSLGYRFAQPSAPSWDVTTWVDVLTNEQGYVLLRPEASLQTAESSAASLAARLDSANSAWRRGRGYVPLPSYRVEIMDASEWPETVRSRGVVREPPRPPSVQQAQGARTPGAQGAPPAAHGGAATVYVVKSGDTLGKIAAKLGTTAEEIAKANNLADPDRLKVGQKLLIPKK